MLPVDPALDKSAQESNYNMSYFAVASVNYSMLLHDVEIDLH